MAFKFAIQDDDQQPTMKVQRHDPFDLDVARRDFTPYRKQIEQMRVDAESFDVTDPNTNDLAVEMMGQARSLSKKIDGLKNRKLKPHNEFRTKLISFSKSFTTPLEDIVSMLKRKTEQYAYQRILEQRALEKIEREAAERRQKELDAQAAEAGVESLHLPQIPVDQEAKVKTRTETGSSLNISLMWKGTVVDPNTVPREYCEPNQKLIDKAIAAGVREIPGVDIKEVPRSRLLA